MNVKHTAIALVLLYIGAIITIVFKYPILNLIICTIFCIIVFLSIQRINKENP